MNKYKLKQAVQIGLAAMVLGVLPLSRPVQAAEETKQLSFKERVQAIANARKEDFALKSEEIRAKRRGYPLGVGAIFSTATTCRKTSVPGIW